MHVMSQFTGSARITLYLKERKREYFTWLSSVNKAMIPLQIKIPLSMQATIP